MKCSNPYWQHLNEMLEFASWNEWSGFTTGSLNSTSFPRTQITETKRVPLVGVIWLFSAIDRLARMEKKKKKQGRCNIDASLHRTLCRWPAHGRWRWRSIRGQYLHLFQKVSSGPLICRSIDKQAKNKQLMTTAEIISPVNQSLIAKVDTYKLNIH